MEQTSVYNQIESNKQRTYVIMTLFTVLVVGVVWVFSQALGWGLESIWIAVGFTLLMNLFSYYFSDSLVLGLSKAKQIKKEDHPTLFRTVENLCIASGMTMPKVYIIEDSAPNAFATGRDPKHASVAITRGLLDKLNKLELEGVIGHELSHIRNYDTRLMIIVSVLVGLVALLADWFLRASWYQSRSEENRRGSGIYIILAIILSILAPLIAQAIRAAVSRRREFLADASSALLTRYPDGLADALLKISQDKEPLEVANRATAHLYIVNPLKDYTNWLNKLFSTHPPIEERVKILRAM